jgi:hypothetical protein
MSKTEINDEIAFNILKYFEENPEDKDILDYKIAYESPETTLKGLTNGYNILKSMLQSETVNGTVINNGVHMECFIEFDDSTAYFLTELSMRNVYNAYIEIKKRLEDDA